MRTHSGSDRILSKRALFIVRERKQKPEFVDFEGKSRYNKRYKSEVGGKMVYQVDRVNDKLVISRTILESLTEWFEVDEAREEYIANSKNQAFFVAKDNDKSIGFLCLKETGKSTVELAVMGVLKEYHRQGVGKQLFDHAYMFAKENGYEFIQVKTVAMGYYDDYDKTNRFYQSLGFKELEIFPELWDKANPCQIYIMSLR